MGQEERERQEREAEEMAVISASWARHSKLENFFQDNELESYQRVIEIYGYGPWVKKESARDRRVCSFFPSTKRCFRYPTNLQSSNDKMHQKCITASGAR